MSDGCCCVQQLPFFFQNKFSLGFEILSRQFDGVVLSRGNNMFNTHHFDRLQVTSIVRTSGTFELPLIMGTTQGTKVLSGRMVCGTAGSGTVGGTLG